METDNEHRIYMLFNLDSMSLSDCLRETGRISRIARRASDPDMMFKTVIAVLAEVWNTVEKESQCTTKK